MLWYSNLFKNFPQLVVIHTVKGFNAEAQSVLVSLLCFLAVSPPFFSVSFSLCVSPCILVGLFISLCIPQPLLHLFCYQGLSTLLYSLSPPS